MEGVLLKAGIGGPVVDFEGNFVDMNFYGRKQGTPFLPQVMIVRVLAHFEKKGRTRVPCGFSCTPLAVALTAASPQPQRRRHVPAFCLRAPRASTAWRPRARGPPPPEARARTVRLFFDGPGRRVLFAEAGEGAAAFLSALLAEPVRAAVGELLQEDPASAAAGCFGNLAAAEALLPRGPASTASSRAVPPASKGMGIMARRLFRCGHLGCRCSDVASREAGSARLCASPFCSRANGGGAPGRGGATRSSTSWRPASTAARTGPLRRPAAAPGGAGTPSTAAARATRGTAAATSSRAASASRTSAASSARSAAAGPPWRSRVPRPATARTHPSPLVRTRGLATRPWDRLPATPSWTTSS
ncbi:hypothetical protein GQ55_5G481800 [Panicum hallii var. hallii]|uniref:Uncharacterized protein n=1 Tax=Panicum hallii var. hallii TaxID=1504633 RepID=A0A2T7DR99_9POAL|nr:hypothetical protein GQ55_5G481800 [Panicum hallii var. hallii]